MVKWDEFLQAPPEGEVTCSGQVRRYPDGNTHIVVQRVRGEWAGVVIEHGVPILQCSEYFQNNENVLGE